MDPFNAGDMRNGSGEEGGDLAGVEWGREVQGDPVREDAGVAGAAGCSRFGVGFGETVEDEVGFPNVVVAEVLGVDGEIDGVDGNVVGQFERKEATATAGVFGVGEKIREIFTVGLGDGKILKQGDDSHHEIKLIGSEVEGDESEERRALGAGLAEERVGHDGECSDRNAATCGLEFGDQVFGVRALSRPGSKHEADADGEER